MTPSTAFRCRLLLVVVAISAFVVVDDRAINVATYTPEPLNVPCDGMQRLAALLAAIVVLLATMPRGLWRDPADCPGPVSTDVETDDTGTWQRVLSWTAPLSAVIASWGWAWLAPEGSGYALLLSALFLIPLAVTTLDRPPHPIPTMPQTEQASGPSHARRHTEALHAMILVATILLSTTWHTWTQVRLWQHFSFGYADIGLFITELEHCLPWKDVGPARFASTRMGYHCIPMFYALAPLYAVFRSPVFLMVVAAATLNVAAWPFAQLARQRSGSAWVGLAVGLAWLLLPSVSRLPYTNTYGFQSIDLAVPWLAWMLCLWFSGRPRLSHLCLVGAMLCEETVCGVALGWGCYLIAFEKRRRTGLIIALASIVYLFLCTEIIIPAFDPGGRYTRLDLFGDVSAATLIERLSRPKAVWFTATLVVPMTVLMWRQWRLLSACLPTLILVLLLSNADYLSIKYWHQASILPVMFAAATLGVVSNHPGRLPDSSSRANGRRNRLRTAISSAALLTGTLLAHQWLGFSPLAHAVRPMNADPKFAVPDPRIAVVRSVYRDFDPATTHVIATERLAMHFTRYRTVRSTPDMDFATLAPGRVILIVDRSDHHDRTVRAGRMNDWLDAAQQNGFTIWQEAGPVIILQRNGP